MLARAFTLCFRNIIKLALYRQVKENSLKTIQRREDREKKEVGGYLLKMTNAYQVKLKRHDKFKEI